jgi:hypothetical protein
MRNISNRYQIVRPSVSGGYVRPTRPATENGTLHGLVYRPTNNHGTLHSDYDYDYNDLHARVVEILGDNYAYFSDRPVVVRVARPEYL